MKNQLFSLFERFSFIWICSVLCLSFFCLPIVCADDQFLSTTIEDPVYWVTEGVKSFSIGDFDSALLMFNTAIALNPQYAPGWNWRSKALTELGNKEAATESLNVAEALEPNIQDPYRMRVGALADVQITPIPTLRPIESDDDDGFVKSVVDMEKKPDPNGADIVVKGFEAKVDPKTNQLNVTTTYANIGLKPTRFFYITFHISSSSRITGEDPSIGFYFEKNLLPGEERTVTSYIPIPRIPIGEWYIAAFADLAHNVIEQRKDNNTMALRDQRLVVPATKAGTQGIGYIVGGSKVNTPKALPDLKTTALSAPDIMYIGEETIISATIQNTGTGDAGPFTAQFILSRDVRVGEDIILSQTNSPGLKAGMATDGTATPVVPDMIPGYYYYGIVLDPEGKLAESEKNNNVAFSAVPIKVVREIETISDIAIADLVVQSLSAPSTAHIGGLVEVTTVLRNDGPVASGPFAVALYLSKDSKITENDILISYGETELPAGTTRSAIAHPTIPADISSGEWYFGVILDPDRVVTEKDRGNNIAVASHVTIIS